MLGSIQLSTLSRNAFLGSALHNIPYGIYLRCPNDHQNATVPILMRISAASTLNKAIASYGETSTVLG